VNHRSLLNRREALLTGLATGAPAVGASEKMPTFRFGPHTISRLIVGGNPVSGNSHIDAAASRDMTDYFTAANVKKLLIRCEQAGINAWQSRGDRHILRLLNEYRLEGGNLQWIAQTATELANIPAHIRSIAASARPIAIYNHGSHTDAQWKAGRMNVVREHCKIIRDCGALVGVGTHIPKVLDSIESEGWDVDFYMTCLFNLSRSPQEASRLAGTAVKGEYFHDPDREEMLQRVSKISKTCLIFKVYGAGRHCQSAERMRDALRLVFRYAKSNDAVVIGMFPKYREQVYENSRLVANAIRSAGVSGT
jgi:hypothetical protein